MTDFSKTRDMFDLPDGVVYMDGNSLGPLPRAVPGRVAACIADQWGAHLITAWNRDRWVEMPSLLGDRIARLIGAEPGHVVSGDTLSIKVWQALAASVKARPGRFEILSDSGNFPSDLYMAEGLVTLLGGDYHLTVVEPDAVFDAISERTCVLMLTEVDYRTGRRHDMPRLTARAHEMGALSIWDLAHTAGALPCDVAGGGADFAVGCTYKFLNGGPGAPAFIYVAPRHADQALPALSGWLGHDAPFAFELGYRPASGIERMRVGTPPILQMMSLDAALDVWEGVDMADLDAARIALSERFIAEVEARCPEVRLATPRDPARRGSQVCFEHPEGYAVMQALIARGVIGDFRNLLRFGITPLYQSEDDMVRAAEILADILDTRSWDRPEYHVRSAVT